MSQPKFFQNILLRLFGLLVVVGLFFGGLSVQAAKFQFDPASAILKSSCQSRVDIFIDPEGERSNAADIELYYDPTEIEIVDSISSQAGVQIKPGNAYESYFGNVVDTSEGKILLAGASFVNHLTSRKIFATIEFKSKPGVSSTGFEILYEGQGATKDSNIAESSTNLDLLSGVRNGTYTFEVADCQADTQKPAISFISPKAYATGVAANTPVELKITDNQSGVNLDTLEVFLNGEKYTSSQLEITGNPINYSLSFQPRIPILTQQENVLRVVVSDLAGNQNSRQISFNIPELVCEDPSYLGSGEVDSDGDGIPNTEDGQPNGVGNISDVDGDGIPNSEDPDIDGDGIPNSEDPDIDGDGIVNFYDEDIDGDGVLNPLDNDADGDGILNDADETPLGVGTEMDVDGDGIPNDQDPNIDGDGVANISDSDMDGDGVNNGLDDDIDGDGLDNGSDVTANGVGLTDDIDGDGIPNSEDQDIDGDGIPNSEDPDIDGDGLVNFSDPDIDGDGIPNDQDDDIDGDGVLNVDDSTPRGTGTEMDVDGDGIPNSEDPDVDGDRIVNLFDRDIDGDGTKNLLPVTGGYGYSIDDYYLLPTSVRFEYDSKYRSLLNVDIPGVKELLNADIFGGQGMAETFGLNLAGIQLFSLLSFCLLLLNIVLFILKTKYTELSLDLNWPAKFYPGTFLLGSLWALLIMVMFISWWNLLMVIGYLILFGINIHVERRAIQDGTTGYELVS